MITKFQFVHDVAGNFSERSKGESRKQNLMHELFGSVCTHRSCIHKKMHLLHLSDGDWHTNEVFYCYFFKAVMDCFF